MYLKNLWKKRSSVPTIPQVNITPYAASVTAFHDKQRSPTGSAKLQLPAEITGEPKVKEYY